MEAPELKPCPFCGGEALRFQTHHSVFIACADSDCPGWTLCRATPEIWNTRAPDPDALQALERVRREARVEGMRAALNAVEAKLNDATRDLYDAFAAIRALIGAERGKP